jgi:chromosome segregation ATPase
MEKSSPKNSLTHLKKSLRIEEQKNKSLEKKYENVKNEIEDLRKKNLDQFECSQRYETEKLCLKLTQSEEENIRLKNELILEKEKTISLDKQLKKVSKELNEFKQIKLVQENCIENAEIEIERLRECLKNSNQKFSKISENVEISQVSHRFSNFINNNNFFKRLSICKKS